MPLAVILIVPMCLLAPVSGLLLRGMDVNILAQIGFVVLIGLAAKNAILIVEFARQNEEHGEDRLQAATEAARVRLRPILMTSFAFILGVLPLVIATGAGAEMRQSLGTAVFFGMLGVTFFGLGGGFDLQRGVVNVEAVREFFADPVQEGVVAAAGPHQMGGQRGLVGAHRPDVQVMHLLHIREMAQVFANRSVVDVAGNGIHHPAQSSPQQ
jgi:hypothetical protein